MTVNSHNLVVHFCPENVVENLRVWIQKLHYVSAVGFHFHVIKQVLAGITCAVEDKLLFQS